MQRRPTATSLRTKRYGEANQMSYETKERMERTAMQEQLAAQREKRMKRGARKQAATTGMNAGEARGGLRKAFFGK